MPAVVTTIANAVLYGITSITGPLAISSIGFKVAVFASNLIAYSVLNYGASEIGRKLTSKQLPTNALTDNNPLYMSRNSTPSGRVVYGIVRGSGHWVYAGVTGTDNEYLHVVLELAHHQIQSIDDVLLNDKGIGVLGTNTNPTLSRYTNKVRVKKYDGTQIAADSDLVSESAEWTSAAVGTDISYIYLRFLKDADAFPGGSLPNISARMHGKNDVFDTRDSTNKFTRNVALCIRDFMVNFCGVDSSEFNDTYTDAAANECDTGVVINGVSKASSTTSSGSPNVTVPDQSGIEPGDLCTGTGIPANTYVVDLDPDGTTVVLDKNATASGTVTLTFGDEEPKYTLDGIIDTSTPKEQVLESMLSAMNGRLDYVEGKFCIRAGAYETPVEELDEADLRGPIRLRTTDEIQQVFNRVVGTYMSPKDNYQPRTFPRVSNSTYLSEDNNVPLQKVIALPFTKSSAMAQRLAKAIMERSRQGIVITMPCKITALRVKGGDTVMVTNTRYGWNQKPFIIIDYRLVAERVQNAKVPTVALGVDLVLRETASTVDDWNLGEETVQDPAPNTSLPDPFTVAAPTNLSLANAPFVQEDGKTASRIIATWTTPADANVYVGGRIEVEYKQSSSGTWERLGQFPGDSTRAEIVDPEVGVDYDVRVRSVNALGIHSAYDTESDFTVTGDTTAPSSITGGALSADGVPPVFAPGTLVYEFGCLVTWNATTAADFSHYEVKATLTNSDGATDYSWFANGESTKVYKTRYNSIALYNTNLQAGYVRVRAVDLSGNASAWASLGNANGAASIGTGDVAKYNDDDVEVSGVKTGDTSASSVRQVKARYQFNLDISLAGGSPTEEENIDLSNRGFSAKPDAGTLQVVGSISTGVSYNYNSGSSTSTNAVVQFMNYQGNNIGAGTRKVVGEFVEYD